MNGRTDSYALALNAWGNEVYLKARPSYYCLVAQTQESMVFEHDWGYGNDVLRDKNGEHTAGVTRHDKYVCKQVRGDINTCHDQTRSVSIVAFTRRPLSERRL